MRRAALGCFAAAALAPAKRDWRCAFDAAFAGDFDNYAQVAAERARGACPGAGGKLRSTVLSHRPPQVQ